MVHKKQKLSMSLPAHLSDPSTIIKLKKCYQDATVYPQSSINITREPFKVVTFKDILQPESEAESLLVALRELHFTFKENDLLSLSQTDDLNSCTVPAVSAIRSFIYSELKQLLEGVTGATYNSTVDLHGICLEKGHNLLPHSDCLSSRHTAFILYLVEPDWSTADGGTLDLFSADSSDQPTHVAESLVPSFNSFCWFEVSNRSWHQVSEVLSDRPRWSISGWFHSDDHPNPPIPPNPQPPVPRPMIGGEVNDTHSWLSLRYLNLEVTSQVAVQFQQESEVSLSEFLNPEKLVLLKESLTGCKDWTVTGPAHQRCYDLLNDTSELGPLREFINLLKSDGFAVFLSHCTGLSLSPIYEDPKNPTYLDAPYGLLSFSVTRWQHRSYSLLSDQEVAGLPDRLHVFYHVMMTSSTVDNEKREEEEEEEEDFGGYISFVSDKTSEPLLVVPPQDNTLSLVFTKGDEWCFTKYVNSRIGEGQFYCFAAQIVARNEEEEEEDGEGDEEEDKTEGEEEES